MVTNNGTPSIRIAGVHKTFGPQTVLDGVEMKVEKGETVVILGRSGTGKSVLLRLLIGLQAPDSGSIEVLGREITRLGLDELNQVRKKVGFVFQYSALYDSLTVQQNVEFPLEHHTHLTPEERREQARALLARVSMEEAADKIPAQISGGMKKRVGVARALALEPEIVLYDEPTAGLDPITAAEIDDLIRELQKEKNMSSVVVTHEMHSASRVADRVALLDQGRIRFEGTFDELRRSGDDFISRFVSQALIR